MFLEPAGQGEHDLHRNLREPVANITVARVHARRVCYANAVPGCGWTVWANSRDTKSASWNGSHIAPLIA